MQDKITRLQIDIEADGSGDYGAYTDEYINGEIVEMRWQPNTLTGAADLELFIPRADGAEGPTNGYKAVEGLPGASNGIITPFIIPRTAENVANNAGAASRYPLRLFHERLYVKVASAAADSSGTLTLFVKGSVTIP